MQPLILNFGILASFLATIVVDRIPLFKFPSDYACMQNECKNVRHNDHDIS